MVTFSAYPGILTRDDLTGHLFRPAKSPKARRACLKLAAMASGPEEYVIRTVENLMQPTAR